VAQSLAAMGYAVAGWSRSGRQLPGCRTTSAKLALPALLARTIFWSTCCRHTTTRGLLNGRMLSHLPRGAA
jgi:phosphoglycerate dehydrogenase-like enzyme